MENENNFDKIIKNYYHAIKHLSKGTDSDLERALIGIDNAFELILKLFFNLGKNKKFYVGNDKLKKLGILTDEEIVKIEYFHDLRNKLYHEPGSIKFKIDLYQYEYIFEKVASNLFNKYSNCLFIDRNNDWRIVDKFFKQWEKINDTLDLFYIYEGDIANPSDPFNASLGLAYYQGIIDHNELKLLEEIRDFYWRLFEGNISYSITKIKDYLNELKNINHNIRVNIIYYLENYDARLR